MLNRQIGFCVGVVLLAICTGCAQTITNQGAQEYEAMIDSMLDVATKDEIARRFGIPSRTAQLGSVEIWEYHKSFGFRCAGSASMPTQYNPYGVSTFAQGRSHEVYDKLTFSFDSSGTLIEWRAYVQR